MTDVRQVDVVQAKNRWLGEEVGYVPGGLRTKMRLLDAVAAYRDQGRGVLFVTLTYNPAHFESAETCYWASRRERHVGEFYRRLERAYPGMHAFCVMEFHPGDGDHHGWIHWHVLIVGPGFIDKNQLSELWGWGFVKVKAANDGADKYLCKYLTKGFANVPGYMDGTSSRVHLTHTTHGFWDVLGEDARERAAAAEPPRPRRAAATIGEIRRAPKRYLRTMMRCILVTGEEVFHAAKADICTCITALGSLGFLGGMDGWREGHATLMLPESAASVGLDYLITC